MPILSFRYISLYIDNLVDNALPALHFNQSLQTGRNECITSFAAVAIVYPKPGSLKVGGCTKAKNNVISGFIRSLVLNTLDASAT